MGVIYGLERIKTKSIVNVYSDSLYVVNGISKGWAEKWKSNSWFRTKTEKATNSDLWARLLILISNQQEVMFNWVRGHAGHIENERCDELAMIALNSENLLEDTGYEESIYAETGYEINKIASTTIEKSNHSVDKANSKIKNDGDPCKKCGSSVIIKPTKKKVPKPGQSYYFEYYFLCPKCKTVYMVEDAKRQIKTNGLF